MQDAHMRPAPCLSFILIALTTAMPSTMPQSRANDDVTIFRCTDAQGRLTLRDSPCSKGERQESRVMARPKDAPQTPAAPTPVNVVVDAPRQQPQIIVVKNPQPMYECVSPDNDRYLSDTPEGNAHWVPIWPVAYPVQVNVPAYPPGQLDVHVDNGHVSGGYHSGGRVPPIPTYTEFGGGTWVRDPCHALPQAEVCDHLRDRRDDIRRRFTIAQPSERAVLSREESIVVNRLAVDCR